jgi:pSer/pThr/pTyr-binding forkhead associated (FHA) protein
MKMRLRVIGLNEDVHELTVASSVARLGRDPACEVPFDSAAYPKVSGEHARIERTVAGLILIHVSRSNQTLLNNQPIEGSAPLKVGDRIRLGHTGPTVEIVAVEAPKSKSTPPAKPSGAAKAVEPTRAEQGFGETVKAGRQHLSLLRGSLAAERF